MEKTKKHERNKLAFGGIYYLSGGSTKVEIMGGMEDDYPLCKVLAVSISSKFSKGDIKNISRKILYPRNSRAKYDYTKNHYWRKENERK